MQAKILLLFEMWLKRSQKLYCTSRSTKISPSTSTHSHQFVEHLITPGRRALKVVLWWEFPCCSSWLKVGSMVRSLVSAQVCPVVRSDPAGFIFHSAHPIFCYIIPCYWHIVMALPSTEFLWKKKNFMPVFACQRFETEKRLFKDPALCNHSTPELNSHLPFTCMIPGLMENREKQETTGIARAICGFHCGRNRISVWPGDIHWIIFIPFVGEWTSSPNHLHAAGPETSEEKVQYIVKQFFFHGEQSTFPNYIGNNKPLK